MDNYIALILLFHGLSITGLIFAIKLSIQRAIFKKSMKALNAAVQAIPPEAYDVAGIALTAAGVPGGTVIASGAKAAAGSLTNPEDPANPSNNNKNNKNKNGKTTELLNNAVRMFGDYGKSGTGKMEELNSDQSRGKNVVAGTAMIAGGTALMGAELSGKLVGYGYNKAKKRFKKIDEKYKISEKRKEITGYINTWGTQHIFKPAKDLSKKWIADPTVKMWNKAANSKLVTGARGAIKSTTNYTKKKIAAVGMAATIKAQSLKMWREDNIDPKVEATVKRVNAILEHDRKVRGRIKKEARDTKGYEIRKKGKEKIKTRPISMKDLFRKELTSHKGVLQDTYERTLEAREKARLMNSGNRYQLSENKSNNGKPAVYYVVNNTVPSNSGPNVKVEINDLNNLYQLRNINYAVKSNPVMNTKELSKVLKDPRNSGMSTKQAMTYIQSKNRLIERAYKDTNKIPNVNDINEELHFIKKSVMMAPGLTPDQAISVADQAVSERRKRGIEARSNAAIDVYNSKDNEEENRRIINKLRSENPEIEKNINDYLNQLNGQTISEDRKKEIFDQAKQYLNGNLNNLSDKISNEEILIMINDKKLNTPEKKAEALAQEIIKREEADKNQSIEQLVNDMAMDPNGVIIQDVFNTPELQKKLTEEFRANDEKTKIDIAKKAKETRERQISEYSSKNSVSLREAQAQMEEKEENEIVQKIVGEIRPENVSEKPQSQPSLNLVGSDTKNKKTNVTRGNSSSLQSDQGSEEPIRMYSPRKKGGNKPKAWNKEKQEDFMRSYNPKDMSGTA